MISNEKREQNYRKQNNGGKLTFRQQRQLRRIQRERDGKNAKAKESE